MTPRPRSAPRYLWVLLVLGFGAAPELKAGFINGSFKDGLSGWTVSNADVEPDRVQISGGAATLLESAVFQEVALSQQFLIDSDATVLSFRIVALTNGSNLFSFFPDAFGVSLLDPTAPNVALTNIVDGSTDSYYIRDLVEGASNGSAATGVSITDLSGGQYRIEIGVADLRGQSALLQFRLIGGGDFLDDASITLTDVTLAREGGGTPPPVSAVPGPAGLVLCLSGAPFVLFVRRFVR